MLRWTLAVIACLLPVAAHAAADGGLATAWLDGHNSKIRLIAARAIPGQPAERIVAGIEMQLAAGWKTYWRMPGEAGVPPTFDFSKSDNVASANVLYPAPTRYPEKGGDAVGYKSAVLFPVEIVAKDPGKPAILRLNAEFGVCREICIPAEAALVLEVPAGAASGAHASALAAAFDRVPRAGAGLRAGDPRIVATDDQRTGSAPRLVVSARFAPGAKATDLFAEGPDALYVPLPKKVAVSADGEVRFEIDLSNGVDLAEFAGKTLRLTLVSDGGASEQVWQLN